MNLGKLLHELSQKRFVPEKKMLEFFPPFLVMGVKVLEVGKGYRSLKLKVPLRWYGKNMHGSMFGGNISAVSDPLAVLLTQRIFKDTQVYVREHHIEFLKPARYDLTVELKVTDEDVVKIEAELEGGGSCLHEFKYSFFDRHGHQIARCRNTVFIRRLPAERLARMKRRKTKG